MMKFLIGLAVFTASFISYGQQNEKKVPELKLASEPMKNPNGNKKPELKLVDPSTAKDEKVRKAPLGKPELKLISK
jgi:hypothetical protein